ncbi:MAG: hypothetical protein OJF59_001981 [Cytophagales bacterium]|nr:MAG: hypothetical protein OJF59_001981 [Cytophagales bacterium]
MLIIFYKTDDPVDRVGHKDMALVRDSYSLLKKLILLLRLSFQASKLKRV